MIDKNEISDEIIDITNDILEKYEENFRISELLISNTNIGYNFLGSIRVDNKDSIDPISKDLEDNLKKYGEVHFKYRLVKTCCNLPYDYINFDIDYKLDVF
ncbi:MAG: hypothetical protein KO202_04490 [Methanobacteriaceae archaeon]|jgi:hypothetical protein|nr:hypothetical protein [Methanobacteriaceae archaeon]